MLNYQTLGLFLSMLRIFGLIVMVSCGSRVVIAQEAATAAPVVIGPSGDPANDGILDTPSMASELKRLGEICESFDLLAEAAVCRRWMPVERVDQTVFYLPVKAQQASAENAKQAAWVKHFEAARARHAEFWFRECRSAVAAGEELRGYQLLWRSLRENPQHAEAKRTLGRLATSCSQRPVVRRSTSKHPTFGWPGNSYSRVESPHFYLTSRTTAAETVELATQLEEFYALWTQYFFPLWSPPGLLKSRLDGGTSPFETQRQIKVVFLRDRADYIAALGAQEANIGVSVGYYDPSKETSYFFPDKHLSATLYHELTHQLLAEATRLSPAADIGSKGDVWLLEGIALYMESLWRGEGYWTLGGWESPRLQVARYRAIRDGYFVPWANFSNERLEQWKTSSDIARLYSQAAGVTHVLLDGLGAEAEKEHRQQLLFKSLVALYQGTPNSEPILTALGGDAVQPNYEAALQVTSQQIDGLRADRNLQELVLAGSELKPAVWQKLSQLTALQWLDLSFTNATSADLRQLDQLLSLERLSVEGTAVDGQLMKTVRKLTLLSELDLTGCAIDDAAIAELYQHPQLSTLWLGKTQVSDAALETLKSLPKLKFVDFQDSKITPAAWAEFIKSHPQLEFQDK